jgi:hypothetical protein
MVDRRCRRCDDFSLCAYLGSLAFRSSRLHRYAFTLPEFVARGELRPLRRPGELSDDDA